MTMQKNQSNPVTIYDVAKEAGVSDATVSRVFNNKAGVKEATRTRVLNAAQKLGYVVNLQARSLAGGKLNVMGVLIPGLGNGYIVEIIRGIDQELARVDYELMIYTTHRKGNNEASYLQYVANGLTEGILLVVPLLSSEFLRALENINYPYTLIDAVDTSGRSFSVSATNWDGAYKATEYLIKLGHRRIGFITGIMELSSAKDRYDGYITALKDYHIPIDLSLIVKGDFQQDSGYMAGQKLLALPYPPTAIFASNDVMALGAMDAIRAANLRIPQDISVVGFDDIPQAVTTYPKLTTIHQPLEEMGRIGVKLLLEQIEHPENAPKNITLATHLVIRDSCQPPPPKHDAYP
ncbi:MAG: LacI family DNA-binding transcriptional regulator [bacterium]|nr:LacI family DNA-binding transcriptional regulator [bacterium]